VDQYIAFISYAHHYRQWVEVLHRNLELCLQHHSIEHKVFLDRADLGSGAWVAQLQEGLEKSAHLILVATPEAIASPRVADEYETFMSIRRDWSRGRLHLLHLVEAPLPAMLRSLQQIDLRNHDEAAYRDGLARLVAGLLRRPGSRGLPELADKIEIPSPPQPALPSALRQRLAGWLEPAVAGKRARRNTAAALGLERTALDHHEQPARAASAAIAAATGDDDPVAAALRIIRIMADELEDGEQHRAAELQALRHEIEGSSGPGDESGLLATWLDQVITDHQHLVPYFQQGAELDLLDRVYIQLELRHQQRDRGETTAMLLRERQWMIRALLDLDPAGHPWVTRRWAVIGDPGAGKTTLLRHLAAKVAQERPAPWVPVMESLPRLMREPEWLLDRIERRLRRAGASVAGLAAALEREGHEGRLLLLLDGLDEVPRNRREEAEALLRQLSARWPATPIVVTSRPIGYRRPGADFQELQLLPFDSEQRRRFLARWFGRATGKPDHQRAVAAAVELEADYSLRELAGNPLYLTLMALLIEKGAAPDRRRSGLYVQVFDLLLDGEHRPGGEPIACRKAVHSLLQQLARAMTEDNRDAEPADELEARLYRPELDPLREQLERVPRWRHSMQTFLNELAEHTGILGPHDGPDADWRFWHRTFREALTAEALALTLREQGEAAILEHAARIAGDESRWAEPYALLVGRVKDPDALVLTLSETNRALGLRAVATAQGLKYKTLSKLLELSDKWDERAEVYQQIPELIGEAPRALALVDQLRRRTRNGNDLFFLRQAINAVVSRWPDACSLSEQLCDRFYDHIRQPPDDLFQWINTPYDGRIRLWQKVPAGSFLMGSPDGEGDDDEHPQHPVRIEAPFLCAAVPVTNAQYAAFDPAHLPYEWDGVSEAELAYHPVERVTWYEAVSFCHWLSAAVPGLRGARLPVEEEWEHACRAGSRTRYWSGDSEQELADVGWYGANSDNRTHRVGEKRANSWGLYDMHGNVWEWTLSRHTGDYSGREESFTVDPSAIDPEDLAGATGGGVMVSRGGGCWLAADWARAAVWGFWNPGVESRDLGFRVVVPASPEN
jgi:formylglycine-generating enzyme required for sulfatase activity